MATYKEIFMSDPEFTEEVGLIQPNVEQVRIRAQVTRRAQGSLVAKSRQGSNETALYDVEVHVAAADLVFVVIGKTKISVFKRIGDALETIMTVGNIIYNDTDHFQLGLIG